MARALSQYLDIHASQTCSWSMSVSKLVVWFLGRSVLPTRAAYRMTSSYPASWETFRINHSHFADVIPRWLRFMPRCAGGTNIPLWRAYNQPEMTVFCQTQPCFQRSTIRGDRRLIMFETHMQLITMMDGLSEATDSLFTGKPS